MFKYQSRNYKKNAQKRQNTGRIIVILLKYIHFNKK